jgi:hypothetical protein
MSAEASITTDVFVAHEILNPNWPVCIPNTGAVVRINGAGSTHGAVG